ncbi:MAG: ATP-binding protein, partial [Acidobacteriota bacterium]
MNEDIEQLLKNLHLSRMAEIFDEELLHAQHEELTHSEFLARLLRAQWHYRQETALAYRIKRARLPEHWTLESFPFKRQPGVSQRQIRAFAELDFI